MQKTPTQSPRGTWTSHRPLSLGPSMTMPSQPEQKGESTRPSRDYQNHTIYDTKVCTYCIHTVHTVHWLYMYMCWAIMRVQNPCNPLLFTCQIYVIHSRAIHGQSRDHHHCTVLRPSGHAHLPNRNMGFHRSSVPWRILKGHSSWTFSHQKISKERPSLCELCTAVSQVNTESSFESSRTLRR